MEFKLAKSSLNGKSKTITLEQIEKKLDKERFYYLDRENEHKSINTLMEYFEDKGYNVYIKEIKYALGDLDYIYEVHIV